MRGISINHSRYYQDGAQIDRITDCKQPYVPYLEIEQQVVRWLTANIAKVQQANQLERLKAQLDEAERRFTRAKTLYLANELDDVELNREKKRLEEHKQIVKNDKFQTVLALVETLLTDLRRWNKLEPIERKRLLRLALERAFVRSNTLVAVQPTIALASLISEGKCSNCGEDRRPPPSYNTGMIVIPPATSGGEALLLVKHYSDQIQNSKDDPSVNPIASE